MLRLYRLRLYHLSINPMPPKPRLDYDLIADQYHQRYRHSPMDETGAALLALVHDLQPHTALEAGCGSGRWLSLLQPHIPRLYGLDYSRGMLAQARPRTTVPLLQADAVHLPLAAQSLDLLYCVNALHHFPDGQAFSRAAYRALRPGGCLAVVGSDPHNRRGRWYVYDYFERAWQIDQARFPTWAQVEGWLAQAGFTRLERRVVQVIDDPKRGRALLDDPFLPQASNSTLALLSPEEYQAGRARLRAALADAEARGEELRFESVLILELLTGFKLR